jgi:hypothetical protein
MPSFNRIKSTLYAAALTLAVYGCGPTINLSTSWVAPDIAHHKFNKIVVLVLAPQKYTDAGRIGEEALATELKGDGINAVSAQDEYGPQEFRNDSEQVALAKLKRSGADGVIVTTLLDVDKEKRYVPGAWDFPPYYGRFWGYYSFWYARAYDPGYYETTRNYYSETNFYELSDRKLLYSIQSKTIDPVSAAQVAAVFSKRVVKDMKHKGVI